MMSELTSRTIAELRDGFRAGEFSAREIATSFNAAVEAGRGLNAWTVETPEQLIAALDEAFNYDGPCLMDIRIESLADRVPPVYSWLARKARDPLALQPEDLAYLA